MKMQQLRALPFESQIRVLKAVDDQIITAKIQTALIQHGLMQHSFIHVETSGGGVELTGWVNKAAQKQLAIALAADIQGVSYVVNNLTVRT